MHAPVALRDVLRILDHDEEVCSAVLVRFRSLGGVQDRWRRADWQAMAGAITGAEDTLEMQRETPARLAFRVELRAIRRRLEDAVEAAEQKKARAA
jgi:hypothetical protein